jgi:translation initiation factor 2 subunit 3
MLLLLSTIANMNNNYDNNNNDYKPNYFDEKLSVSIKQMIESISQMINSVGKVIETTNLTIMKPDSNVIDSIKQMIDSVTYINQTVSQTIKASGQNQNGEEQIKESNNVIASNFCSQNQLFDASEQTNEQHKEESIVHKPNVQEINTQEVSMQESSMQETNMQETSMQETSMQKTSIPESNIQEIKEISTHDSSMQELNTQESNTQESSIQETNVQEASIQESNVQESDMQGTNIQEQNIQEPNIQEPNTQESITQESNMQDTSTQERNTQERNTQERNTQERNTQERNTQESNEPNIQEVSAQKLFEQKQIIDKNNNKTSNNETTNFVTNDNEPKEIDIKEIMKKQPIMNVGTIGHVANGKSTMTERLSSKGTQQFSTEKERNCTIVLGYANVKIWKCNVCDYPQCVSSSASSVMEKICQYCNNNLDLDNHISIVDCPGHSQLTATMLNGSSVMDYTILVEACNNENIPAPQTQEHLIATRAANIPTSMIIMNKIDLVNKKVAQDQIKKITDYYKSLIKSDNCPPVIPISATMGINIDVVCHQISKLKMPENRNITSQFKMIVIRSFDVNKPGTDVTKLSGGVIGGTIMRGLLKVNDKVSVYPGMTKKIPDTEQKKNGAVFKYEPIVGTVLSIQSDTTSLDYAIAGGLLAIQLTIDPGFSGKNNLAGSVVFKTSDITNAFNNEISNDDNDDDNDIDETSSSIVKVFDKIIIKMNTFLINQSDTTKYFKKDCSLMTNINSNNINCIVHKYDSKKQELFLKLNNPVAIDSGDNLATVIYQQVCRENTILGRGIIIDGVHCEKM